MPVALWGEDVVEGGVWSPGGRGGGGVAWPCHGAIDSMHGLHELVGRKYVGSCVLTGEVLHFRSSRRCLTLAEVWSCIKVPDSLCHPSALREAVPTHLTILGHTGSIG